MTTILSAGPSIKQIIVDLDTNKDCFTAACLLLGAIDICNANGEIQVKRKSSEDITESELDNPAIALIGVGGKDVSSLRCFDQPNVESIPKSSVTTKILQLLGLYELAFSHYAWLDYYDTSYGKTPASFATKIADRIKPNPPEKLLDFAIRFSKKLTPVVTAPVESAVLHLFNQEDTTKDYMLELMSGIGRQILSGLDTVQGVENVLAKCDVYYVGPLKSKDDSDRIKVFDSTDIISGERNSTTFVNNYLNDKDHDVSVVVSNDTRGSGISFFRRNENPSIDFSVLASHPDVIYASEEGQLAKTDTKLTREERIELIQSALKATQV